MRIRYVRHRATATPTYIFCRHTLSLLFIVLVKPMNYSNTVRFLPYSFSIFLVTRNMHVFEYQC